MTRLLGLVCTAATLVLAGCGAGQSTDDATLSTAPSTTQSGQPAHNGQMQIGDTSFGFAAQCYLPGNGNITVTGAGVDADTGLPIDLLLRNIPARPYIGVRTAGRLIEADLAAPLTFVVDEGKVSADNVTFVQDLDLLSGVGKPAGSGSVEVQCDRYIDGEPLGQ